MILRGKQRLLALMFVPMLCANVVHTSTRQELFAKSDLVIFGRVVAVDLTPPPADPVRVENNGKGDVVIFGPLASAPCVRVVVERQLKGTAASSVVVCSSMFSEESPKPQQLGKRYSMFLISDGKVYVAASWDGVTQLK